MATQKTTGKTADSDRSDGKTRILDAAERLFAEKGYDKCSLRDIAAAAEINVGLMHYFFKTKENLFKQTYLRRGILITEQRIKALDLAESESADGSLDVETILRLFLTPAVQSARTRGGKWFAKIQARLQQEHSEFSRNLRSELYDESSKRYVEAFARALPSIPRQTIYWRFVFILGTYQYVLSDSSRRIAVADGDRKGTGIDTAFTEMINFLAAGMRAAP